MRTKLGISLIEVLAAIFVVSVGLLGVLAVIPFGAVQVSQARHADYASNMLVNALQEIQIREMAKPTEWGIGSISSGNPPVMIFEKQDDTTTTSTLNCTKFFWVEPFQLTDPADHIFCVGSTFTPTEKWAEIMRGQDDLYLIPVEGKRPAFASEDITKQSSGKYTWFFTFKPKTNINDVMKSVIGSFIAATNGFEVTVPAGDPPKNLPLTVEQQEQLQAALETEISTDPSRVPYVVDKEYAASLLDEYMTRVTASLGLSAAEATELRTALEEVIGSRSALEETADVDVLACYNRVPSSDVQAANCGFVFSAQGGTFTLPTGSDHFELLAETKYVFVTWKDTTLTEAPLTGAWCRINFVDKPNRKIIVTGDLPKVNMNTGMYVTIPSGVLYHKRLPNVPIR